MQYLVLHAGWCLTTERGGCALTEVWDAEEPDLKAEARYLYTCTLALYT